MSENKLEENPVAEVESSSSLTELYRTLITANHILHYQKVVDAYGHISVRHPDNPDVYIISGSLAPALVESSADLFHYHVADSTPIDPEAKQGYQERYIHGEMYKRFPGVMSVVHSHSEAVLPYTMNRVSMLPAFHMAGFLGEEVPVFNVSRHYERGDQQDMLVNSSKLGAALSAKFVKRRHEGDPPVPPGPNYNVVLMQNHGFTTFGSSIQQAVYRAVYTHINAGVQSTAIMLRNAQLGIQAKYGYTETRDLKYLTSEQSIGCQVMNDVTHERPWRLWVREVGACSLYVNSA